MSETALKTSQTTSLPPLSRAEAATELLKRRTARKRLLAFTEYTKPDFESSWHHEVICGALEEFCQDVEAKNSPRLLIEAPPRHTKSELGSRRFPAWVLGKHPKWQYIATTYSGEFASDFGRDVRDIVQSHEYTNVFHNTRLRQDSSAVNRWQTTYGGVYVSVGVGGPITGRGAHVAGIDDPIKNQQDADSETMKESIWAWYTSTLYTRLMPGGGILMILTRWAEDDLAGRATESEDFRTIKLPAIMEGKALWPSWFDMGQLQKIKHAMPPRQWSALYMQDPTPEEGVYFDRESFKRFRLGEEPERLHRYITSDFAVTEKDDADFTVFGDWGLDADGHWWLLNRYKAQSNAGVWIDVLVDWFESVRPMRFFGEGGVIRRSVEPFLKRVIRERKAYNPVSEKHSWITRNRDKVASAASFRGMCEQGLVHIPLTDWGEDLISTLLKFPAGEHDDDVDMCSLLGMAVDQGIKATPPPKEDATPELDAWGRPRHESSSWKTA